MERSTSVLDMHFNIISIGIIVIFFLFSHDVRSEVLDRVVASVDDIAITETELNIKYASMQTINSKITLEETLETMINRVLLIKDAKRFRLESKTEDELIEQYIDLKIRALIRVTDKEVRAYYEMNKENFSGKSFDVVSEEIVKYLTELKVNTRLKENLEHLREKSNIIKNIKP